MAQKFQEKNRRKHAMLDQRAMRHVTHPCVYFCGQIDAATKKSARASAYAKRMSARKWRMPALAGRRKIRQGLKRIRKIVENRPNCLAPNRWPEPYSAIISYFQAPVPQRVYMNSVNWLRGLNKLGMEFLV